MNSQQSNRGMKRAMRRRTDSARLPSNFTYTTMQRVDKLVTKRKRREEVVIFVATTAASLLIAAFGIYATLPYIKQLMAESIELLAPTAQHIPMFVITVVLITLNEILKRIFKT